MFVKNIMSMNTKQLIPIFAVVFIVLFSSCKCEVTQKHEKNFIKCYIAKCFNVCAWSYISFSLSQQGT